MARRTRTATRTTDKRKTVLPKPSAGRNKVITTVNLEPEVRAYLDRLMDRHDRDRSYIVNALVKKHMNTTGEADETVAPPLL